MWEELKNNYRNILQNIASVDSWKHHLTWEEVHISVLGREPQTSGPHYFSGFGSHLVQYLQYEAMIKTW